MVNRALHCQSIVADLYLCAGDGTAYTALGLVVAAAGLQFQAALSTHTCSLASPSSLPCWRCQCWLVYSTTPLFAANTSHVDEHRQQGGSPGGVFVMGAIAGLSVHHAPPHRLARFCCISPKAEHVAGRRHALSLCVGHGPAVMLITVFGNRLLPKSGPWMEKSKPRLVL